MLPLSLIRGAAASATWARTHGLDVSRTPHWYVEIQLPTQRTDTRLDINLYPEEWGLIFRREGRVSSIRVTDVPFVHGLDDDKLLRDFPQLVDLHRFLDELERRFEIQFARQRPLVHSNVTDATTSVRAWLDSR